jgi:hypothetical protein
MERKTKVWIGVGALAVLIIGGIVYKKLSSNSGDVLDNSGNSLKPISENDIQIIANKLWAKIPPTNNPNDLDTTAYVNKVRKMNLTSDEGKRYLKLLNTTEDRYSDDDKAFIKVISNR